MNKKVLRTIIYLCWAFLVAFVLLKTVWADKFAIAISSPNIINVGNFIDNHVWLRQIVHCITSLLTYQFYLCACCRKWHLSWKQYLIFTPIIIGLTYLTYYFPMVMMNINFVFMFAAPFFLKANYIDVVIIFSAHVIGQVAISLIRSQPINLVDVNIISQLICGIDMYVWLLLYYLYSNLYKESIIKMGSFAPPVWSRKDEINKEIARTRSILEAETDAVKKVKLQNKINELEAELAKCED